MTTGNSQIPTLIIVHVLETYPVTLYDVKEVSYTELTAQSPVSVYLSDEAVIIHAVYDIGNE